MKTIKRVSWIFVLVILSACSAQRFVTVDQSAYMTPELINSEYHPEGIVEERFYPSTGVPGPSRRRMLVYLPEGYYESEQSYPVLYLIHGARGNETSWIKDGDMIRILDSLQRSGLAVPMITVLPNMNQYDDDQDYGDSRFKHPVESLFEVDGTVESGFVNDVVGFVDREFRTIPEKRGRCIAGLSIGAMQSIHISAAWPDCFDYVGLFSPMVKSVYRHSANSRLYKKLEKKMDRQFLDPPALYYIGIGRTDIFYGLMIDYRYDLDKKGYRYEYFEGRSGHGWKSWRTFYSDMVQKIFKS